MQENGEVFVQAKENEAEPAKEAFLDFPEKVVLAAAGQGFGGGRTNAADARDADILVPGERQRKDVEQQ